MGHPVFRSFNTTLLQAVEAAETAGAAVFAAEGAAVGRVAGEAAARAVAARLGRELGETAGGPAGEVQHWLMIKIIVVLSCRWPVRRRERLLDWRKPQSTTC